MSRWTLKRARKVLSEEDPANRGSTLVGTLRTLLDAGCPQDIAAAALGKGLDDAKALIEQAIKVSKPVLAYDGGEDPDVECRRAMEVLKVQPDLFVSGEGAVVKIESRPGSSEIVPVVMDVPRMRRLLAEIFFVYAFKGRGEQRSKVGRLATDGFAKMLLVPNRNDGFRFLRGIARLPYMLEDGTWIHEKGWNERTGMYLDPLPAAAKMNPIPPRPSNKEIAAAIKLLEAPTTEYEFNSPSDRANALAMMITAVLHGLWGSATPIFGVSGDEAGIGKTKLAQVAGIVRTGALPSIELARIKNGALEEDSKRVTTRLRELFSGVEIYDNADGVVRSQYLAALVTAGVVGNRLLGSNTRIDGRVEWLTIFTGNGLRFEGTLERRAVMIHIRGTDQKNAQRIFAFDPVQLAQDRWLEMRRAVFVLYRAWLQRGMPKPFSDCPSMGSFERFRETIGGMLRMAGVRGFLATFGEQLVTDWSIDWGRFLSAVECWQNLNSSRREAVKRATIGGKRASVWTDPRELVAAMLLLQPRLERARIVADEIRATEEKHWIGNRPVLRKKRRRLALEAVVAEIEFWDATEKVLEALPGMFAQELEKTKQAGGWRKNSQECWPSKVYEGAPSLERWHGSAQQPARFNCSVELASGSHSPGLRSLGDYIRNALKRDTVGYEPESGDRIEVTIEDRRFVLVRH